MEGLPAEIIREIKYFYQLPEIDIIGGPENPYFQIKCQLITSKFKMFVHKEYYWHERGYRYVSDDLWLDKFIEDLTNNKDCNYDEFRYVDKDGDHGVWDDFNIEYKDGIIRIYNEISEISLTIESKDRIIKVLKNYRDQLATIGGCSCS